MITKSLEDFLSNSEWPDIVYNSIVPGVYCKAIQIGHGCFSVVLYNYEGNPIITLHESIVSEEIDDYLNKARMIIELYASDSNNKHI